MTALTPLAPFPTYGDPPSVFNPQMAAAYASLVQFVTELNLLLPQVQALADNAAANAVAAVQSSLPLQTTGTFVPTLTATTPPSGVTLSSAPLNWIKSGRIVLVTGRLTCSSLGSGGSGNVIIGGLPFPIVGQVGASISYVRGIALASGWVPCLYGDATNLYLSGESNTANGNVQWSQMSAGFDCMLAVAYETPS